MPSAATPTAGWESPPTTGIRAVASPPQDLRVLAGSTANSGLQTAIPTADTPADGRIDVSEPRTISVAIVDDHPILIQGLEAMIEAEADMTVVATAHDGNEAVRRVAATHPDVVVMDVRMPGCDGVEAAKQIISADPHVRIILLSGEPDASVVAALQEGVYGFLSKTSLARGLIEGIRDAAKGRPVIAPALLDDILVALRTTHQPSPLTHREREVLESVARGWTNEQIAHELEISVSTVKAELTEINEKTGASDRASALAVCLRKGWIQ
jgi:DNA-binding NarL/FixJ family response regulator